MEKKRKMDDPLIRPLPQSVKEESAQEQTNFTFNAGVVLAPTIGMVRVHGRSNTSIEEREKVVIRQSCSQDYIEQSIKIANDYWEKVISKSPSILNHLGRLQSGCPPPDANKDAERSILFFASILVNEIAEEEVHLIRAWLHHVRADDTEERKRLVSIASSRRDAINDVIKNIQDIHLKGIDELKETMADVTNEELSEDSFTDDAEIQRFDDAAVEELIKQSANEDESNKKK